MGIANRLKAIFLSIMTLFFSLLARFDQLPLPLPLPPNAPHDPEMAVEHHPQPARPPLVSQPARLPVEGQQDLDWAMIMIAFCLTSAVAIALQSVDQAHAQLPPIFYLLSLAITFAFSSLFVSKFIYTKFPTTGKILERVGIFFAVTSFFFAITIPFPLWLLCTTWTIYAISMLAIVICNCF